MLLDHGAHDINLLAPYRFYPGRGIYPFYKIYQKSYRFHQREFPARCFDAYFSPVIDIALHAVRCNRPH